MITGGGIQRKLREIDDYPSGKYVLGHPPKNRDWRAYEPQFALRIRTSMYEQIGLMH